MLTLTMTPTEAKELRKMVRRTGIATQTFSYGKEEEYCIFWCSPDADKNTIPILLKDKGKQGSWILPERGLEQLLPGLSINLYDLSGVHSGFLVMTDEAD